MIFSQWGGKEGITVAVESSYLNPNAGRVYVNIDNVLGFAPEGVEPSKATHAYLEEGVIASVIGNHRRVMAPVERVPAEKTRTGRPEEVVTLGPAAKHIVI